MTDKITLTTLELMARDAWDVQHWAMKQKLKKDDQILEIRNALAVRLDSEGYPVDRSETTP